MAISDVINRIASTQHIMNGGTFQCRATCNLKESTLVFEAFLAITFCKVQRDRVSHVRGIFAASTPMSPTAVRDAMKLITMQINFGKKVSIVGL